MHEFRRKNDLLVISHHIFLDNTHITQHYTQLLTDILHHRYTESMR